MLVTSWWNPLPEPCRQPILQSSPNQANPAIALTLAVRIVLPPCPKSLKCDATQALTILVGPRGGGVAAPDSRAPDCGNEFNACVSGCRRQRPSPALS